MPYGVGAGVVELDLPGADEAGAGRVAGPARVAAPDGWTSGAWTSGAWTSGAWTPGGGPALVRESPPAYDREPDPNPFRLHCGRLLSRAEVERIEELAAEIGTQSAEMHAAEYARLVKIAEFDRTEGWKLYGHRNCAAWLAFWTGMDLRTARARVRTARALEHLPLTSAAMRRGELSFSKVRAIARLGPLEPEKEEVIVEFALESTAVEVEKLVRRTRFGHRKDEEEQARRRRRNRKLVTYEKNGLKVFHAELEPEAGALVERALEMVGADLYRQEREEPLGPEKPELPQRQADALEVLAQLALVAGFGEGRASVRAPGCECGAGGAGAGPEGEVETRAGATDPTPAPGPGPRAGGAAAAEAGPPGNGPAGPPDAPEPPSVGSGDAPLPIPGLIAEPYQVFLHLDPEALRTTGDPKPKEAHLENGTRVSAETARRLCCSASVVPVVRNGKGEVLNIGRRSRVHTAAIRRALWVRDRGCKFPGCGVRFTVPHHVRHWADGGATSLDNSVLLCAFHHNAVHHDGFVVRALGGGRFRFFTPEGLPLGREGARMLVKGDDPAVALIRRNRRRGVGRPRWDAASARYESERQIPDELLFRAWEVVDEL
jgi:hypothetical protein